MKKLQKIVINNGVKVFLNIQAFMFRNDILNHLGYKLNHFIARNTIRNKKINEAKTLKELGENWQKGFPSKKEVPIVAEDNSTIYAEVQTKCPLRGTGDVLACYKLMSYDREIVSKAGGQFIVLTSQAEKGVEKCEVAIRFKGEDTSDLQHAHNK
jgi:hypothetical protein